MTDAPAPQLSPELSDALQILAAYADMGINTMPAPVRGANLQQSQAAMRFVVAALMPKPEASTEIPRPDPLQTGVHG